MTTDKTEYADTIIYDIIQKYPEYQWLEKCKEALPDYDDYSIVSAIEIFCGGDLIEKVD